MSANIGNGSIKLLKCQLCQKEVVGINGLNSHLQEFHGAHILMKCNLCGKSFMEHDEFRNHLASHRSSSSVNKSLDNEPTKVRNSRATPKPTPQAVSRTRNSTEWCQQSQNCNTQSSDSGDDRMDGGNDDLDGFYRTEEDYLKVLSPHALFSEDEPKEDNNIVINKPISLLEAIPKYGVYPCQSCDILLKREDHLEAHEKLHRLRVNCQFQCPKCRVFIATLKEYKKHNHRIDKRSGKPVNPDNKWLNKEGQYYPPSSSKERRLYCKKCDVHFPTISQRVKHREQHRNEIRHQCDFCEAKFEFKYNWAQHMLRHPENKRILCRLCGKEFKHLHDLNDHWLTKEGCDPERITCEVCGKSVIRRYHSSHMSRHTGVGNRECDVCGKFCSDPAKLRFHRNTHFDTRGTSCKFCSYTCNNPASLHNHMSYRHLGPNGFVEVDAEGRPKPFMCQVCGECWTSELALQEHLLYHGEKSVECDKCPKVFYTKHQLRFHRTKHRQYKCKDCGKTFNATDPLKIHIRSYHTGEIPYTCDHCGKGYKSSNTLMYHIRSCHTGEKRYECEMCSKRFVSKGNLNHHRKTHPDFQGAYSCFVCQAIFKVYNDMKKHSIDVHGSFKRFQRKLQV